MLHSLSDVRERGCSLVNKLYCPFIAVMIGKLFCYVVEQFRRCNLSRPEESVCHFWTLYINQNVVCSERFAMFDRTDPLRSQNKSAK